MPISISLIPITIKPYSCNITLNALLGEALGEVPGPIGSLDHATEPGTGQELEGALDLVTLGAAAEEAWRRFETWQARNETRRTRLPAPQAGWHVVDTDEEFEIEPGPG